jgi:hypothetical protein
MLQQLLPVIIPSHHLNFMRHITRTGLMEDGQIEPLIQAGPRYRRDTADAVRELTNVLRERRVPPQELGNDLSLFSLVTDPHVLEASNDGVDQTAELSERVDGLGHS